MVNRRRPLKRTRRLPGTIFLLERKKCFFAVLKQRIGRKATSLSRLFVLTLCHPLILSIPIPFNLSTHSPCTPHRRTTACFLEESAHQGRTSVIRMVTPSNQIVGIHS